MSLHKRELKMWSEWSVPYLLHPRPTHTCYYSGRTLVVARNTELKSVEGPTSANVYAVRRRGTVDPPQSLILPPVLCICGDGRLSNQGGGHRRIHKCITQAAKSDFVVVGRPCPVFSRHIDHHAIFNERQAAKCE